MGFNVTMIDPTYTGPNTTRTLLQSGPYKLEMTYQEEKVTKDGSGKYIEYIVSVIEPAEFSGNTFYQKFHTENTPGAMAISTRLLAGIGNAVGVTEGDWPDLLYKPFIAEVTIEKNKNVAYPDTNQIGRVYWEEGSAPAQLGPKGPPAASTAAPALRPIVVPMTAPVAAVKRAPWPVKR